LIDVLAKPTLICQVPFSVFTHFLKWLIEVVAFLTGEPTSEAERYLQEPTTADSPANYWLANKACFPVLSAFAKRYLSAPPTSVPSERVFSTTGDILTDKRSRLSTDNAEKLLILKENLLKF